MTLAEALQLLAYLVTSIVFITSMKGDIKLLRAEIGHLADAIREWREGHKDHESRIRDLELFKAEWERQ